jgi:hypothetical protein
VPARAPDGKNGISRLNGFFLLLTLARLTFGTCAAYHVPVPVRHACLGVALDCDLRNLFVVHYPFGESAL